MSGSTLHERVHRLEVRVYHEDTDFTGVVYHGAYVRFAERGRSDMLRLLGVRHEELLERAAPKALMVYRMEMDFLGVARVGDALQVETRVAALQRTQLDFLQMICRSGRLLWRGRVVIIAASPEGRARRLPEEIMSVFAPLLTAAGTDGREADG